MQPKPLANIHPVKIWTSTSMPKLSICSLVNGDVQIRTGFVFENHPGRYLAVGVCASLVYEPRQPVQKQFEKIREQEHTFRQKDGQAEPFQSCEGFQPIAQVVEVVPCAQG